MGTQQSCTHCCSSNDPNDASGNVRALQINDNDETKPLEFTSSEAIVSPQADKAAETLHHGKDTQDLPKGEAFDEKNGSSGAQTDYNFSCTPAEVFDFVIKIVKNAPSDPLGMTMKAYSGATMLVIKEPEGKYIENWNAENPNKRVRRADQITAVNGVSGDATAMLQALKARAVLELKIRRQVQFTLSMVKGGQLGIHVGEACDVLEVLPAGLIDRWNQITVPQFEIVVGDQVVKVDQATTDLSERLKALKDGERCSLTFMRPKKLIS